MADGYEFGWEDTIEKDGPDYVLLPEGEYDFEVVKFERSRYSPREGAKLPPCNMAVVHIKLLAPGVDPQNIPIIKHNLHLHSQTEGLLCAFFTAIGQRKKGERVTMNWNAVVGAKGRCKVIVNKWKGEKDGKEMTNNRIDRFLEPEESTAKANFQAGRF